MNEHTEASLLAAIQATYPPSIAQPRYICAFKVNEGAGFSYRRTLDAVVFDTWPSEGLYMHGFEVKISAGDLRRELQDTSKSAAFTPHLDTFSIVAPKDVVDMSLIPKQWGVYHPTADGRIKARRKPLMLHAEGHKEQIDRSFTAAFVRAVVQRSLDHTESASEYQRGHDAGKAWSEHQIGSVQRELDGLKQALAEFEKVSGVHIHSFNGRNIGEAVAIVLRGGLERELRHEEDLRRIATRLTAVADEFATLRGDGSNARIGGI